MSNNNRVVENWRQLLLQHRVIAIIRASQIATGTAMAQAVADGGIKLIEVSWNSSQPAALISRLRAQLPDCTIGVGTILNSDQLQEAIAAGAQFVFCPHFDPNLLKLALHQYHVPLIPGALSPTEIVAAWQAGATAVKVFPIQTMGGASYLNSLRQPLCQIDLIPTGGVTIDNARALLDAGAIAIGLSGDLFPAPVIAEENWHELTRRTRTLLTKLEKL